jgi:hypothetical protein
VVEPGDLQNLDEDKDGEESDESSEEDE